METIEPHRVKRELEEFGIKPVARNDDNYINIAVGHPQVRTILRNTAWAVTYAEIIERVSYCKGVKGPSRIGSLNKRFLQFEADGMLLDSIPF